MRSDELKPCPFCGAPASELYVTFERGYLDDSAIVFCNACKVSVKLESNDQEGLNAETEKRAIEAWNRRAERKPGKWIKKMRVTETEKYTSYNPEWYCGCCGTKYDPHIAKIVNFCYVCGEDMRGKQDE